MHMLVRGQAGGHEACAEVCLAVSKISVPGRRGRARVFGL
jgi:hypothetical protein